MRQHQRLLRQCRQRPSAKAVHRLRVTTRRLLAHLDIVREAEPKTNLKRTRKALKALMAATSRLRDAQVQRRLFADDPRQVQADAEGTVARDLKRRVRRRTRKLVARWQAEPPRAVPLPLPSLPPETLALAAERLLRRRHRQIHQGLKVSLEPDVRQGHRIRVALKKARYVAEALPAPCDANRRRWIKHLPKAQAAMGEVRDLVLLHRRSSRHAASSPKLSKRLPSVKPALARQRHILKQLSRMPSSDLRN